MMAPLRFMLSIALSVGLAATVFASSVDAGDAGATLAIGNRVARGTSNGVIFSGNFVGPVTWTLTTLSNGTQNYALAGVLTEIMGGATISAITISAITMPLRVNTALGPRDGSPAISGGDEIREESVPEPSMLALFGTGSLGLLGAVAKKRRLP